MTELHATFNGRGVRLANEHGSNPLGALLTASEADTLAAELTKAAADARANERRCATCAWFNSNLSFCFWRTTPRVGVPLWVMAGFNASADAGDNCPAWTKREGGQAT